MKYLLIVIISCFVMACNYIDRTNHLNNHNNNNTTVKMVKERNEKNISKEDFNKFIVRFHRDSVFRNLRMIKPVHGYDSEEDTLIYKDVSEYEDIPDSIRFCSRIWTDSEVLEYLSFFNYLQQDTLFSHKYEVVSDSCISESVFNCGTSITLTYIMRKNLWYLELIQAWWL